MHHVLWVKLLGYAGLIPFIPLALAAGYTASVTMLHLLAVYSFGIFSFLVGSWWGIGLLRYQTLVLCLSNALFLVAATLFAWLSLEQWLAVSGILFVIIFLIEGRLAAFVRQPDYYRRLRLHLTLGVAISQFCLYAWIS